MKLYDFVNGDTAYRYEKSIVVFFNGRRKVLSTSLYNGGYREDYTAVYNHDGKQGAGMPCELLAPTYEEHMQLLSLRLGLDPKKVSGMVTAADMENAVIESMTYENLTVTALVTGGIETNGGRAGDPADYFRPKEKPQKLGTINIILHLDCDLPPGIIARALVTCTEAKTAAIQELLEGSKYSNGLATGSGTDQTIIVANGESPLYLDSAGKHSKLGELIGKTVTKAVKGALAKQSGLTPERQHDVLRRWRRFGLTAETLWQQYLSSCDEPCLKPLFLKEAELLAQDGPMLTCTSLYIHLIDQCLWHLVSETEAETAGRQLLGLLAAAYGGEVPAFAGADFLQRMQQAWQDFFLAAVLKNLQTGEK